MKYSMVLDDILGQKSKVRILRYLSKELLEMNGRQIAADLKMSPWSCHKALNDLCSQGILFMRNVGNTHLFRLNDGNHIVKKLLLPLFKKERNLLKNAIQEITKEIKIPILSIILFGSVVRREEKPYSDFDFLVLLPSAREKRKAEAFFVQKNEYFLSKFGNVLSPYILSLPEFRRRFQRKDKLLRTIVTSGQIIYGKQISEVL